MMGVTGGWGGVLGGSFKKSERLLNEADQALKAGYLRVAYTKCVPLCLA